MLAGTTRSALPRFSGLKNTNCRNSKCRLRLRKRPGERVEVDVQADYYFGGAVANAGVEVLVYQNPFYHYWYAPHEYAWYYEDLSPGRGYWGGQGQIIKHEMIKTDAAGKAHLVFDTPQDQGQDFEYRIEARVT